ncbi:MAG: DNA polymerase III subunit delta [Clostridia bacterium]|nr:DNA polymerase III subunit delta [Clostridia bacterium]
MLFSEQELKQHLKTEEPARLYVLYGEEAYLTAHYTERLIKTVGGKQGEALAQFNLRKFDGQDCSFDAIEEAAEALPLMADKKCVAVRDCDVTATAVFDRAMALVADPPEDTVLIFWMTTLFCDGKKSAKFKQFLEAADKTGICVEFPRKTNDEIVKMLVAGAGRRGSLLRPEIARRLVEQCGNDLNLLLNELDKLCAVAGNGEITAAILEQVATKNLHAQAYELSNAILQQHYEKAYQILHRLFSCKAEPVMILGALSSSYADLYRAKIAAAGGVQAQTLVEEFDYKGKAFRLKYAARDCSHLSVEALRESLDILAQADRRLKSGAADKKTVLEETAAKLIVTAKLGRE